MDKKVLRPLWSFDVPKTENWLSDMGEQGYQLTEFKRYSRLFIFKKGSPIKLTYKIGKDKKQPGYELPKALNNDGWRIISNNGPWFITANEQPANETKTTIVQENLLSRNKKVYFLFISILLFITVWFFTYLMDYLWLQSLPEEIQEHLRNTGGIQYNPLFVIPFFVINLFMIIFLAHSVYTIRESNKLLSLRNGNQQRELQHGVVEGEELLPYEEENRLKKEGKLAVKRNFGWKYAPDKLEEMLEEMELKGYKLYRVSWSGISFYFLANEPRHVSYEVDFQHTTVESILSMHSEAGWKLAYISPGTFPEWRIWSQEYEEGQDKPVLYSDSPTKQKHARKIAVTSSLLFIPLTVMYLYILWQYLSYSFDNPYGTISWPIIVLFSAAVLMFSSFVVRSWLYFLRLKKMLK